MFDVAVVGAGPAGSMAARLCAEAGLSTVLLEEHATIGHPIQCAGLLSTRAFEECGVSQRCVLNRLSGARIFPSEGEPLLFDAGVAKAYVVDRGILDREMAELAVNAGARLMLKQYVRSTRTGLLETAGMHGAMEIRASIVIGADGVRSGVARALGFPPPSQILSGIQADLPCELEKGIAEVHPHASPDFFGWAIPLGEQRVRVGLLTRGGAKERFLSFARHFGGSLAALVTGAVPVGARPRTCGERAILIGDAAGFAKPTSGGGVFTGVRSARHAAAVAVNCCERDSYGARDLGEYERRWRDDFGRELAVGMELLLTRQQMTPAEVDRAIALLRKPETIRAILEDGDMDRPSILASRLVRRPEFWSLAGILLRARTRHLLFPGDRTSHASEGDNASIDACSER